MAAYKDTEVTSPGDSAHSSPTHISPDVTAVRAASDSLEPEDVTNAEDAMIDEQLKAALVVEELKKGRPELRPVSPSSPSHTTTFQGVEMIY